MQSLFKGVRKTQRIVGRPWKPFLLVVVIVAITFGALLLNVSFGFPSEPAAIALSGLIAVIVVASVGNFHSEK